MVVGLSIYTNLIVCNLCMGFTQWVNVGVVGSLSFIIVFYLVKYVGIGKIFLG